MKKKHEIERLVEETMNSLDGVSRAKSNPFLYTRIQARLLQPPKSPWEALTYYLSRPAIAVAMLCMVLLSNGLVMYQQSARQDAATDQTQLALTEEYRQSVSAFYDEENPEP